MILNSLPAGEGGNSTMEVGWPSLSPV
jgi:hypothetical protein